MTNLALPPIGEELVVIEATPAQNDVEALNVRDKGTIQTLLGAKNEIWIGEPRVYAVDKNKSSSGLPSEVQNLSVVNDPKKEYVLVHFACSFRPAPNCEFVRASLEVEIVPKQLDSSSAIAFEIFPTEVYLPITYKRAVSITPTLKLQFEKVMQIEASAFKTETSAEYITYQPELTAFGQGDHIFGWDFNKSSGRTIRGVKELFVVLQRDKAVPLEMEIKLSDCYLQTNIGRIPLSTFLFLDKQRQPMTKRIAVPAQVQ